MNETHFDTASANAEGLRKARLFVVMGVSGSGKSTIGEALADRIGAAFIDADDLHPRANVAKMAGGHALEDSDRWPWLEIVANAMRDRAQSMGSSVCACSALKRSYRDFLVRHAGEAIGFVHLHGDKAVIAERQSGRKGHFMPSSLLKSQFDTLEPLARDELGVLIDVSGTVSETIDAAARALGAPGQRSSTS
ncbi:gluconokinase [Pelagibacterium montanilacus]|uniref:gluconokinase n=1 Tax=Pelagibacterium montanilacus TaxID=2185280 RepID=UPI0019CFCC6F|nr:gluconokinase [Pelagibacterium montanilacus]